MRPILDRQELWPKSRQPESFPRPGGQRCELEGSLPVGALRVLELSEPPTQTALRGHDFVDGEFPEGDFFWLAALQAARAPVMERESLRNAKTAFDQVLPGVDGSTFIVRQSLNASALPRSSFRWNPMGPLVMSLNSAMIVELPCEARSTSTATLPSSS